MSPCTPCFYLPFFMHYEEEILCYTNTCFDFAHVKKSIFQFSFYLELLISSTKDILRNIRKCKQIPCYKGNWIAWLCRKSVSDLTFLVSIVARLRNERPGIRIPAEARYSKYLFPTTVRLAVGLTQPPFQRVPWDLPSWVKWLEREADHSLPSSAEVTKDWSYTLTPPICLHGL